MVKTIFNEFSTFLKNTDLLNREFDNYVQNEFKTICDLFKRKIYRCEVVKPVVKPTPKEKVKEVLEKAEIDKELTDTAEEIIT